MIGVAVEYHSSVVFPFIVQSVYVSFCFIWELQHIGCCTGCPAVDVAVLQMNFRVVPSLPPSQRRLPSSELVRERVRQVHGIFWYFGAGCIYLARTRI